MAQVYEFENMIPVVDPSAFVHENAILIGDVIIGPGCYVGPAACLRGDFGRLRLGTGANIQDTCVMHGFPGYETLIDDEAHIGHGAVIHGCKIGKGALIGMNAVIMDDAVIGEFAIVGALSFVSAGFQVPPRTLAVGSPAKIIRPLSDGDLAWKQSATRQYQDLAVRSTKTMRACEPLDAVEPDRRFDPDKPIQPHHIEVKK